MLKPEIKKAYIIGTGVKFRKLAGRDYAPGGMFVPNEQVWLLNTAIVDGAKWHRVKNGLRRESVWVIDALSFRAAAAMSRTGMTILARRNFIRKGICYFFSVHSTISNGKVSNRCSRCVCCFKREYRCESGAVPLL